MAKNAYEIAKAVVGQTIDMDGAYGGQCMDLAVYISMQIAGIWLTGNANQAHLTPGLSAHADIIPITPGVELRVGDIINGNANTYGHIVVYGGGPLNNALVIDQNFNSVQVVQEHRYNQGVYNPTHIIRFRNQANYTPTGANGGQIVNGPTNTTTVDAKKFTFWEVICEQVDGIVGNGNQTILDTFYLCNKVTGDLNGDWVIYNRYDGSKGYLPKECLKRKENYDRTIKSTSDGTPINKYAKFAKQTVDGLDQQGTQEVISFGDFMTLGRVNWGGYQWTYYSQSVLPGGGLSIPGRHVNAHGYVADGDGYIVLAAPDSWGNVKGKVYKTPFGYMGKVYDVNAGGDSLDVYVK